MNHTHDHATVPDAALAARYRQRRLGLLVLLLAATVVPVVAMGAWWLWPLLVVPAALAAPLAGGTGLIATLLAAAIALAAASSGDVASAEVATGFVAVVVMAALGAAHAGMTQGVVGAWTARRADRDADGHAPRQVFDLIAHRDCRRAAETGSPVAVAIVAVPRVDLIAARHGAGAVDDLLDACTRAVTGAASRSDLVVEESDGRYVALVAGTAEAARDLGDRLATALESVAVRDRDGLRVTTGEVGVGVAQWSDHDTGPDSLIERASADLSAGMVRAGGTGAADDQVTGEFRGVAVPDAA